MTDKREELRKRCDDVLGAARRVAEKARDENRELTADERERIDEAIAEAKRGNEMLAADAKHRRIMGELDAMAASAAGAALPGDGRRLAFGKAMASDAAQKIMPAGGSKALGPSGIAIVSQEFQPDPVALGRPANTLLSVMPVKQHTTPEFAFCVRRRAHRTPPSSAKAERSRRPYFPLRGLRIRSTLSRTCPRRCRGIGLLIRLRCNSF